MRLRTLGMVAPTHPLPKRIRGEDSCYIGHDVVSRMKWDHFFGHSSTSEVSFEALSRPFFDRLDIFSSAIDLKNTLVVFKLSEKVPIDSFEATCCDYAVSVQDLVQIQQGGLQRVKQRPSTAAEAGGKRSFPPG